MSSSIAPTEAKLAVVLGTYNRIDQLRRCVQSIINQTTAPYIIYITDAGSTDGTVEYLRGIASVSIVPILAGEKLGQAKAYNDVFQIVAAPYTVWLSDDNEVVDGGLDRALSILENNPAIGLVGLKTKDKQGRFRNAPYIGGISPAGILNVNQGMLPTDLLKKIGGFSEEFRDYGIDPALTADVLYAGYTVVYTKKVALLHYRNWSDDPDSEHYKWLMERHSLAKELYIRKYCSHANESAPAPLVGTWIWRIIKRVQQLFPSALRNSVMARDLHNILVGRYIRFYDPLLTFGEDYHLVQRKFKN